MSTRGIQFLNQNKIVFEVIKYEHAEKGAAFAAQAVGFPLAQTIKTLVVALDSIRFALVLMPGDCHLSMKKVAAACRVKRAALADSETAERLTGYQVGGISPFGTRKRLPTLMHAALQGYPEVMINAGQRGVMVKLSPLEIVRVLKPGMADLAS
jgi:Cys-tRNA(Pro)/Cys-tRNA(Cys) deacylase